VRIDRTYAAEAAAAAVIWRYREQRLADDEEIHHTKVNDTGQAISPVRCRLSVCGGGKTP